MTTDCITTFLCIVAALVLFAYAFKKLTELR